MSRYAEKKVAYKVKGEQVVSRFGFAYNEEAINYRTQIPPLPEKPKHKPDQKIKEKKIQQVAQKIEKLKEQKRKNKEISKKLTAEIDQQYKVEKNKIDLGKKCILVLEFDIEKLSDQIRRKSGKIKGLQNKVENLIFELKALKGKHKPAKKVYKKMEQMTNRELDQEKNRIELKMSTKSLTKKEQSQLNNLIYKISRLKLELNRPIIEQEHSDLSYLQQVTSIESEIAFLKDKESKIKQERQNLFESRAQLQFKIDDIKEDISFFISKLKEINSRADQKQDTKKIREESDKIKESIKKLEEDVVKIQNQFSQKIKDYEAQQEKIKWIGWATKIQEKKREEWQQQKAERKKQKLKEKAIGQSKKEEGKIKDQKTGEKEKPAFQRKKINRNQKQIDVCSFLLDYCKRLIPTSKVQNIIKKESNPQEDIKNAKWAKGLEVVKSKKARDQEQQQNSKQNYKKKLKKQQEVALTNSFTHEFFVEQYFHSANILPPAKPEQLQKIIKDLEDKLEYYINHPDQTVEEKFAKDKQFVQNAAKNATNQGKYTKSKGNSKAVINSEDFPTL